MNGNVPGIGGFRDFIASLGYEPPDRIEPGRWFRFSTNGKRGDTAGSARLFPDCEGGIVFDWRTGDHQTWQSRRERPRTEKENRLLKERIEKNRMEAQIEREREARSTAERARKLWAEAAPADDAHPYLRAKGVRSYGLRIYRGPLAINEMHCDGALIVPARDVSGAICSLSFIAATGDKRYLPGPRPRGCYFAIGTPAGKVCVVEGYATGASVHYATGYAVAVAFDAGNLEPAARAISDKVQDCSIVVCADNDVRDDGGPNVGVDAAIRAATAVSGLVAIPQMNGRKCDFNDLAQEIGIKSVARTIDSATAPAGKVAEPKPQTDGPRAVVRRFSEIESKPIRWLWPGRIARGKVSMLAGNPGLGKSQVTASMAAIVTRGGRWPVDRSACEPGSVVFLSAEDDAEDTIRPRLEAAGADLSKCAILDAVVDGFDSSGGEIRRGFNLKTDLARLSEVLEQLGDAALVVIDPISAYLGGADSHNNAEIRALLAPLSEMAAKHGAAVVAVSHLNKGGNNEALLRVTGSLAFVAAARGAFIVVADKDDPQRRLFLPLKNNIGRDVGGLAFSIEPFSVASPNGEIESSRVSWESAPVTITADEAMTPTLDPDARSDLDDAMAFLKDLLRDGPVPSRRIQNESNGAGHSWATMRRAQKALRVEATKGGMKEGWVWRLPPQEPPKMLKIAEDAQPKRVSTFGADEHLQPENDVEVFR